MGKVKKAKAEYSAALSKLDRVLEKRVKTFAERTGITGGGLERELAGETAPKKEEGPALAHEDGG